MRVAAIVLAALCLVLLVEFLSIRYVLRRDRRKKKSAVGAAPKGDPDATKSYHRGDAMSAVASPADEAPRFGGPPLRENDLALAVCPSCGDRRSASPLVPSTCQRCDVVMVVEHERQPQHLQRRGSLLGGRS